MVLEVKDSEVGGAGDMEDLDRIRVHFGENLYQELPSNKVRRQDQK